jgi:glycosyltransferase involved in cell wall biosynthesis
MVVAEANSHGIPVLITDIGGIPSLMRAGQNGEMLSPEAGPREYADRLMALSRDRAQYEALSRSSFEHFREYLTWTAWSTAMIKILKEKFAR